MIRIFLHCERFSRSSLAVGEYCGVVTLQKTLNKKFRIFFSLPGLRSKESLPDLYERVGDLVVDLSSVGGGIVTSDNEEPH